MTDDSDQATTDERDGRERTPLDPVDPDGTHDESVVETDATKAEAADDVGDDARAADTAGTDAGTSTPDTVDAPANSGAAAPGIRDAPTDGREADFDDVRSRAAAAVERDDLASVYVGLVDEDGRKEYYFANAVEEAELRRTAAEQLGMMTRVLAEQSTSTVNELVELAAKKAEAMDLR